MSDLISRDALMRGLKINYACDECRANCEQCAIRGVLEFIKLDVPAVDAAPVAHGQWLKSKIPCEEFVCSVCGGACWYYEHTGTLGKSRYCPTCGAKMDAQDVPDVSVVNITLETEQE